MRLLTALVCLILFSLNSSAVTVDVTENFTISQSRHYFNRIDRVYKVPITIINSSANTYIGRVEVNLPSPDFFSVYPPNPLIFVREGEFLPGERVDINLVVPPYLLPNPRAIKNFASLLRVNFISADAVASTKLLGAAVKGPVVSAEVEVYLVDTSRPGLEGELVARGSTVDSNDTEAEDGLGRFNVRIPNADIYEGRGPFIVKVIGGTELDSSSGMEPIIPELRTIVTIEELQGDLEVFATPLTSLTLSILEAQVVNGLPSYFNASGIAVGLDGDGDGKVEFFELQSGFVAASQIVKDLVGLTELEATSFLSQNQADIRVDLLKDSPVFSDISSRSMRIYALNNNVELDEVSQRVSLLYRRVSENFSAVVKELMEGGAAGTANEIVSALGTDVLDGKIDGQNSLEPSPVMLPALSGLSAESIATIVTGDPSTRFIPNTTVLISDIYLIMSTESLAVSPGVMPQPVEKFNALPPVSRMLLGPDADKDGIVNSEDLFPFNPLESKDSDGDCESLNISSSQQASDKGNTCGDNSDGCPFDPLDIIDTDNDGACDYVDQCPTDPVGTIDQDGDGICFGRDFDDGNASVQSICDAGSGASVADKIAAGCIVDTDGDGTPDSLDACPNNPNDIDVDVDGNIDVGSAANDFDNDGSCDAEDADVDNDGALNADDAFDFDAGESVDCDLDGTGDNADTNTLICQVYILQAWDVVAQTIPAGESYFADGVFTADLDEDGVIEPNDGEDGTKIRGWVLLSSEGLTEGKVFESVYMHKWTIDLVNQTITTRGATYFADTGMIPPDWLACRDTTAPGGPGDGLCQLSRSFFPGRDLGSSNDGTPSPVPGVGEPVYFFNADSDADGTIRIKAFDRIAAFVLGDAFNINYNGLDSPDARHDWSFTVETRQLPLIVKQPDIQIVDFANPITTLTDITFSDEQINVSY